MLDYPYPYPPPEEPPSKGWHEPPLAMLKLYDPDENWEEANEVEPDFEDFELRQSYPDNDDPYWPYTLDDFQKLQGIKAWE